MPTKRKTIASSENTDDYGSFQASSSRSGAPKHVHGEYVRGEVHTNGVESFWALVRRGYNGTFHHIEPKHLHRYINEFAGRLSDKAASAVEKMGNIVQNLVGKRLTYKQLVASKALCGAS